MKPPELANLQRASCPQNAAQLLNDVLTIQAAFRDCERTIDRVGELISAKYRTQHWRKKALDRALGFLETPTEDELASLRVLSELQLKLPSTRLRNTLEKVVRGGNRELLQALARTLAEAGEAELLAELLAKSDVIENAATLRRIAGPRRMLPIRANAPSRMVFRKWAADPEFSEHEFVQLGGELAIRYRAITFLPGDLLVSNVNRDGNGVYTALQSPRSYAYHLGVVAIIKVNGRNVPVVIEGYKLGVRAVPLSTFLAPEFNSYVEVCRLRERPADFHARLNEHAALLPRLAKGYNFDTEDPDMNYLACTSVASCLYQRAGVTPVATKSRYDLDPQVRRNMAAFDFGVSSFLSLTDFVVDERMSVVGAVDNDHFIRNVARELCERHFRTIFGSGDLNLGDLPLLFTLNRFGVRQMRQGTWLGAMIGLPYGLTQENLPRGPEKVLAIIEIYEHQLEKAVSRVAKDLSERLGELLSERLNDSALLEIDDLYSDSSIVELLDQALAPISRAYGPARSPEQAVAQ